MSSAPQPIPLPLHTLLQVVVVIFVSVTRSLFAYAICYHPCVLRGHTISTFCCPFSPKLFVVPAFFLWWLNSLQSLVWWSLQLFFKNSFLYVTVFSSTCYQCPHITPVTDNASCHRIKYSFLCSIFSEIYLLQSRLYNGPVTLLACSILFKPFLNRIH